jgi:hypothetical protein
MTRTLPTPGAAGSNEETHDGNGTGGGGTGIVDGAGPDLPGSQLAPIAGVGADPGGGTGWRGPGP